MVFENRLRLTEIFYSLQGETSTVGIPTVFVRLTGCPLRCQYCDTAYAFSGGNVFTLAEILEKVASFNARYVTVTGGEPLAQKPCLDLLKALCDKHYRVSLETSGALSVAEVDPRVIKIVDFKTPGSKEMQRNVYENVNYLNPHDEVKFVICDEQDYQWSKGIVNQYDLTQKCQVLFSPSYQQLPAQQLAHWILADCLPVRFQIQLHKVIWGDVPGK